MSQEVPEWVDGLWMDNRGEGPSISTAVGKLPTLRGESSQALHGRRRDKARLCTEAHSRDTCLWVLAEVRLEPRLS